MMFEELADACPLKPELVSGGLDMVVVRELIGGIYFGERGTKMTDMGPCPHMISSSIPREKCAGSRKWLSIWR